MSVTFPTIELGDLGVSLDDAIRSDPEIAAEEAETPDAKQLADGASDVETPVAAEAEPVAETVEPVQSEEPTYESRFEADYAERSKRDFAQLRSGLDRQITRWQQEATRTKEDLEETANYVAFLESKLADYDPDEVQRFQRNRQGHAEKRQSDRRVKEMEFRQRLDFRDREFRRLYPDIDPNDPELMEAFRSGDAKLERALIRERLAWQARGAPPAPAPRAQSQGAPPAPTQPRAERDSQGRFVARAEETRRVEQARGVETAGRSAGAATRPKPPSTFQEARAQMQAGFAKLGIPQG